MERGGEGGWKGEEREGGKGRRGRVEGDKVGQCN